MNKKATKRENGNLRFKILKFKLFTMGATVTTCSTFVANTYPECCTLSSGKYIFNSYSKNPKNDYCLWGYPSDTSSYSFLLSAFNSYSIALPSQKWSVDNYVGSILVVSNTVYAAGVNKSVSQIDTVKNTVTSIPITPATDNITDILVDTTNLYVAHGSVINQHPLTNFSTFSIFSGHKKDVNSIAFYTASNTKFLLSGSADGTVKSWNLATRATIKTYTVGSVYIHDIASDDKFIYVSSNVSLTKWNITSGTLVKTYTPAVEKLILSGSNIYASFQGGIEKDATGKVVTLPPLVSVINKDTLSLTTSISTQGQVTDMSISGNDLYVATTDKIIRRFDVSTLQAKLVSAYIGESTGFIRVVGNGETLYSGSGDKNVRMYSKLVSSSK